MEKDGTAGGVEEFIQGNLQAARNVHYALSTFCKPENQLIWHSSFAIQDKERVRKSHMEEKQTPQWRGERKVQEPSAQVSDEVGAGQWEEGSGGSRWRGDVTSRT